MLCKIRMGACEYCRAHYCETHFFDHACFFLPTVNVVFPLGLTLLISQRDEAYELGKRKEMEEVSIGSYRADWQIEALFKLLQSSTDSIKRSAEALRPGHTCTLQFPSSAEELKVMAGGMNVHIPLRFEDGVEWMVRIRQQRYGNPPKAFVRQTILSEAATQNALNDAGCKVPRAFLPPLDNASDGTSDRGTYDIGSADSLQNCLSTTSSWSGCTESRRAGKVDRGRTTCDPNKTPYEISSGFE